MAEATAIEPSGSGLSRLFTPSGRVNRRTYAAIGAPCAVAAGITGTLLAIATLDLVEGTGSAATGWIALPLLGLLAVAVFLWVTTSIKRLHDIGLSGLVMLFVFTPLAGPVFILLVCLVAPGDTDTNAHGPAPGRSPAV